MAERMGQRGVVIVRAQCQAFFSFVLFLLQPTPNPHLSPQTPPPPPPTLKVRGNGLVRNFAIFPETLRHEHSSKSADDTELVDILVDKKQNAVPFYFLGGGWEGGRARRVGE